MNIVNGKSRFKCLFKISFCISILMLVLLVNETSPFTALAATEQTSKEKNFCYLSDIPYDSENCSEKSKVGWGKITLDQNLDTSKNQGLISLIVNGEQKKFLKGISAHANSILIFDIDNIGYDYFSTYFGVDASRGKAGNGVWFKICTKTDYNGPWKQEGTNSETKKGNSEAGFVTIDIRGKKLLKLEAYCRNGQDSAHACYANAKFYKEGHENDGNKTADYIKTVEEYDKIIKAHDGQEIKGEYELAILQRDLVNKVGYDILQGYVNLDEDREKVFKSVFNDAENLSLFTTGGKPEGTYIKSFDVLAKLYEAHEEDLSNTTLIDEADPSKGTLGDLYKRMMYAISLTHSGKVYLWITGGNVSNPVERYEIYKDLYSQNLIESRIFETLKVEELRWVMNTVIDNEEIKWLNNYTRTKKNGATGPYSYIRYTFDYNYSRDKYYAPENYDTWNAKYNLSDYNITYKKGNPKLWIVFEEGSVCGGLSKTGSCVWGSYKGLPNTCVSQPVHCAYIYYNKRADGKGIWGLGNDVFGWAQSGRTEHLNTCIPLDWGDEEYINFHADWLGSATYVLLAQGALNDYDNYVESEKYLMIAEMYKAEVNKAATDEEKIAKLQKLESVYEQALEAEPINIDAWWGLIKAYRMDSSKTEADFYRLAEGIFTELKYYPLPMYHLGRELQKDLKSSPEYTFKFTMQQEKVLKEAKNATDAQTIQRQAVRQVAERLLGIVDSKLATFSFDGENAGAIKISSRFDGSDVRWDYSLDGGKSWTATSEHIQQLTKEELASITPENDIKVHIVGVGYTEENIFTIDIKDALAYPTTVYANDLENKLFGTNTTMKWKLNEGDEWTSFTEAEPDLTGDKTLYVKMGATGVYVEEEGFSTYTFTEENQPNTRKYIPIKHLSIDSYSTQSTDSKRPFYAPNAIDGNLTTLWHTDFAKNVLETSQKPFITIALDEPRNISALEFIQRKYPGKPGDPDGIKNARVYVSMDGERWEQAGKVENCQTYGELYEINFEDSVYGKYVKLEVDTYNMFASAAMINLYEDTTKVTLATFSFDGENANKIMLVDTYKTSNWEYSLDAGATWKKGTPEEQLLSEEELNKINDEDNIKVRVEGKDTEYTINIRKQEVPTDLGYLNDLENRLIGIKNPATLEWRLSEDNAWKNYSEEEPVVTGDRTLLVRTKAAGIYVASDAVELQFTDENCPDTEKYIPIKHLSIEGCSTESPSRGEPVGNAIDGNINTMWHTDHVTPDPERYIIIKLDEPRYISKLQYVRKDGYLYGVLKDGIISTSMNGENWEEAVVIKDLYNPANKQELAASENIKDIKFDESKEALYVKLQCTKSCDYVNGSKNGVPYDYFVAASMLNLFEDTTKKAVVPTAEVEYDITELTNKDVTATLVNPSTEITVTNNEGKTEYTFTENGEFTFEFVDNKGTKGTVTAKVDWIDKEAPIGTIEYDIEELTNKDVKAILITNEDVTVINNDGKDEYTFTENGEFEFIYRDKAGNESKTTAIVKWIDKEAPEATVKYDITAATTENVVATIECDEEITIINNDGENTYTFTENDEFEFIYTDKLGNEGRVTAKVDWIDREAPIGKVSYDITEITGNNVVATLEANEEIVITNNNGKDTYTFTENGEFEFTFVDKAGNEGKAIAKVDWIDKELPEITVIYDIEEITNKDVTARIESDKEIEITNNDGKDEYTFTENGEFIFEYVTKAGKKGEVTVKVDWIDKEAPIAKVSYDVTIETTGKVVATLEANEEIIVINNDGKDTYTFTENGEFEFVFRDKAGNEGKVIAKVTWIIVAKPSPSPSDTPTPSPSDTPTPSPSDTPTPSPSNTPTPSPSDTPTPSPSNTPTPSPSDIPTPSPSDTPTPNPSNNPSPSQSTNPNSNGNKTSGTNNPNTTSGEEKSTGTQTKTTTSNSQLPYTGYEDISVAFRRIFLTISIFALLAIAVYSFYNMKK